MSGGGWVKCIVRVGMNLAGAEPPTLGFRANFLYTQAPVPAELPR